MAGNTRSARGSTRLLWAVSALAVAGLVWMNGPSASATAPLADGGDRAPTPPPKQTPPTGKPGGDPDHPDLWDPGDEVVPPKPLPTGKAKTPAAPSDGKTPATPGVDDGGPAWSVLIGSFTGEDHAAAAAAAKQRLSTRFAEVRDCFVRRVPQGSVLLVGRFGGPSDPAAQAKLKELKAIVVEGQRPFAAAMLTRVATDAEPPGPYDVRHLRERFPNTKPLYSLQVAAWSTFGDKAVSRADMRAAAEKFCKELRAKNVEAWVHHDDDSGTSVVTVGHFDHTAYDSKSTLFSPEVERFKKKFPRHLVNGEEVLIPIDPKKPDGPKRPQGCQLVEIPLF